ncbi:MAG: hypothetical protein HYX90_03190, partial [Chloroflexi bacterium]|nr:hypothetical protein [Chloroflexota bacterium]
MRISTRLRLGVYVPAVMALVIIVALMVSYQDFRGTQRNGDTIQQVRSSITELNHIVFSYTLYHGERPKQQFMAGHEQLMRHIARAQADVQDKDQQRLLSGIRENSVAMKDLFIQLASTQERSDTPGIVDSQGAEDQMVGLLLLRSYQADVDATRLGNLVDASIRIMAIRTFGLIFLVLVLST